MDEPLLNDTPQVVQQHLAPLLHGRPLVLVAAREAVAGLPQRRVLARVDPVRLALLRVELGDAGAHATGGRVGGVAVWAFAVLGCFGGHLLVSQAAILLDIPP